MTTGWMVPPCAKTSLQSPKNLTNVCYLVCEKQETKNHKCSILLFVPPDPHSNGLSPPETTPPQNYHPTTFIIHHYQHYPNSPSRIKLSVKSPTSSATTETTGTNSAPRQPIPQRRPGKLPTRSNNHQNTRLAKTKDSLLLT